MNNLDVILYDKYNASIKDISHELDISDTKWDKLLLSLMSIFDAVYFKGYREYFIDEDFNQTVNFLSEKKFIEESGHNKRLMFRLKETSMMYNRNLVEKMWQYFEFPSLIFLGEKLNEADLVYNSMVNQINDVTISNVDDVIILQRLGEQNVLWIKGNLDLYPFILPYQ